MPQYDIETLNTDIAEFSAKYKTVTDELKDDNCRGEYLADAGAVIEKYPEPDGEVRARLGKFCQHIGCWTVVFGNDLKRGVPYYHKAIETAPEVYNIRFDYFTTLQEIIPNEDYRTPEILQDAIDCLTFCLNACDTWEKKRHNGAVTFCEELAKVYKILGQPELSKEYKKKGKEIYKELVRRRKQGID